MAARLSALYEAEAIAEIARRISSSLELEQVLQAVVDCVLTLVRADVSFIALAEPGGALRVAAVAGGTVPAFRGSVIPPETGMGGRALATGEIVMQRGFWDNPAIVHDPDVDDLMRIHDRSTSMVALPIIQGDDRVGVLWATRAVPARRFSRRDLTLLKHLTAQAAIAIRNARSLANEQQARAEVAALAEIGQRISGSLNLDNVLRSTAESAQRLLSSDVVAVVLPVPEGAPKLVALIGNRTEGFAGIALPPNGGPGGHAMAGGRSIQATWEGDALSRLSGGVSDVLSAEGIVSSLVVPIRRGSESLGVFWIHSRTRRVFSEREIELLERIALQAAIGIANARTHADQLTARAQVEALLAATAGLGAATDPAELLREVVVQAAELLHANVASYAVLTDARPMALGYWNGKEWIDDVHEIELEGSIQGLVWGTRQPYRTNNLAKDPHTHAGFDARYGLRSQLTVPLLARGGDPVGLVSVYNSRETAGFTPQDERLLLGFAEYAASAYRRSNATLVRQAMEREASMRRREVEALLEVADRLTAAADPGEVLRIVMDVTAPLLRLQRVGIVTNEGDHALSGGLWDAGVWRPGGTHIPLDGSISGWVIRNKQVWKSDNLTKDPLHFQGIAALQGVQIGSSMAVPIFAGDGRVLGVLNLHSADVGDPFSDEDIRLGEGMARHVAIALERMRLVRELRESEERFRHQAFTDSLTMLPNRASLLEKLGDALNRARDTGARVALIFLDLDGFKLINDSLGHSVGDEILGAIAHRLGESLDSGAMVARIGGDEFVALLECVDSPSAALQLAERLVSSISRPFQLRGRERYLTASAGVSVSAGGKAAFHSERLLREADIALYAAKARGKGRTALFEANMSTMALERMDLESDLQRALSRSQLELYYQPIYELKTQRLRGAEALLRWNHPRRGLLVAKEFIQMAEETGLLLNIGDWSLEQSCRQASDWRAQGNSAPPVLSVNLSATQFQQADLVARIAAILQACKLDPATIEVEITESAMIQDMDAAVRTMRALRDFGCRLAIDDFGTGYSSLSYLRRLAADLVKIDQSFIAAIDSDPGAATIVRAVIDLAHALGITVTAEGIETDSQLQFLRAAGCDFGQGFLLSPPLPSSELDSILHAAQVSSA